AITEDTPLHKSILHVVAEDADLGLNGEIYYSILDETEQFAVHPTTGVITLTRPLRFAERALHELTVVANDRGIGSTSRNQASKARVKIKVLQVSCGHSTVITRIYWTYAFALPDILENSNTNIFGIVRVTDKDKGVHGQIKSLDIVDGDPDGHFRIKPTDRPGEYVIEVHRLLDRETAPAGYNLTLRAVDRGVPPKQSYLVTPVRLADINDNAPVFNREIYEVSVPETSPPNTPVIRLKVTDRDEGKNAKVFLEIVGGNEGGEFRVNPETGMLYTAVPLDAELKAFYTLTVSAIDQGNPGTRKQSSAKVKINVQDTNDNDPIFETANLTIYVDENEPAGTSVTKVTARDKDLGENAYISYSIANLNDVPFDIDHFSGTVRTSKLLDYESMRREYVLRDEYLLNITVYDLGKPQKSISKILPLTILDENDNVPKFEKSLASFRVTENAINGTIIFRVKATDADLGQNAKITYSLVTDTKDFRVDPETGVLTVVAPLDRERQEVYELKIRATDGGGDQNTPALYSDALVRVTVDDINDNAPEFAVQDLTVRIREDVPRGTVVTVVSAIDLDSGTSSEIVYSFGENGDGEGSFRIDKQSGTIRTARMLDFEERQVHSLIVKAIDRGTPSLSSETSVIVEVIDVNENRFAPQFEDY
ncbi:AGAP011529-PA, partial [Anopheles gambiae str. PEST]